MDSTPTQDRVEGFFLFLWVNRRVDTSGPVSPLFKHRSLAKTVMRIKDSGIPVFFSMRDGLTVGGINHTDAV